MVLVSQSRLQCFNEACREPFAITEVIYNCPRCGGLLECVYDGASADASALRRLFRERRMSNTPLDRSGVWRYREMFPFLPEDAKIVTLSEGNTPLLDAPLAASYGGLDALTFKHQGFNPTGSFKDNGMTCGVAQALRLGMRRVACVSTGNTSASMAAYAASAGLEALIFLPHGNISFGKLAQALEYGARTIEVDANFDQILKLVRVLAERLGIYLLNSVNPFRIEGQKSIVIEMLEQRDWKAPDWIVLPGGNLGNTSAFGKALRELKEAGFIEKMPRLAVIQAEGSAPFYDFWREGAAGEFRAVEKPETLATAIRIGDPVSWTKAVREIRATNGVVEKVTEQEIADAKAQIGRCGIGCEPASAATLAGIRKLTAAATIDREADVVAVLTGNVLKDPDYIHRYHTGRLETASGVKIRSTYANQSTVVPNDAEKIASLLSFVDKRFDDPDSTGFYHGTKIDLKPGDLIGPGYNSNYGKGKKAAYVYLTATLNAATWGAELARGEGPGRIYIVEPTGPIEDDPNLTDKKFPGNPTKSYRSRDPLRVTGEITDWKAHSPEELKAMKDGVERARQLGIEAIED